MDFHVDKYLSRRNERTLASSAKTMDLANRFSGKAKFPKKAMLFGFVGSDGIVFPPVWVHGNLDAAKYKTILVRKAFPALDGTYGARSYVWIQDGARAHTTKTALACLERKLGSKGVWLANLCNLNPLDFSIWDYVESRACKTAHNCVHSLKDVVEREWAAMPASYISSTCKAFRRHVEAMIAADGGVFEKY